MTTSTQPESAAICQVPAALPDAPAVSAPALTRTDWPWRSITPQDRARIALLRFGLGPKTDTPATFWSGNGDDIYDALLAEIDNPDAVLVPDVPMNAKDVFANGINTGFLGTPDNVAVDAHLNNDPANSKPNRINLNGVPTALECGMSGAGEKHLAWLQADIRARHRKAIEPVIGFAERLVLFWSNHFSIHWGKDIFTRGNTGYCERKAIRPYVLGSFPEMLKQVIQQPAMIAYLDNTNNIGPGSTWTFSEQRHIIENLAREVLELHTVGKEAGYTQNDVMELALVLTGFTVGRRNLGEYWHAKHEQGTRTILCKNYEQTYRNPRTGAVIVVTPGSDARANSFNMSKDQALNVLDDLANRPETATHLATKLIRHFLNDSPKPASVETLAACYKRDGGNLKEMTKALLTLPEAWALKPDNWTDQSYTKPGRVRTPQLTLIAMNRALGLTDRHINAATSVTPAFEGPFESFLAGMNHSFWSRITPDGYPDVHAFWRTENMMRLRRDLTYIFLNELVVRLNRWWSIPFQLPNANGRAQTLFPNGGISEASLALTRTMPNDPAANLTLLFMTYEYMRR